MYMKLTLLTEGLLKDAVSRAESIHLLRGTVRAWEAVSNLGLKPYQKSVRLQTRPVV